MTRPFRQLADSTDKGIDIATEVHRILTDGGVPHVQIDTDTGRYVFQPSDTTLQELDENEDPTVISMNLYAMQRTVFGCELAPVEVDQDLEIDRYLALGSPLCDGEFITGVLITDIIGDEQISH